MSQLGINTHGMRARREALGLSQRSLGRAIGESESTVRGIERNSGGHGEITLSLLSRLAAALDISPGSLLTAEAVPAVPATEDDVARVLGVLLEEARVPAIHLSDIAAALEWSPRRVRSAINGARQVLGPLGISVWRRPGHGVTVRAVADALADSERERLARANVRRRGMNITHLRLLARVAADDVSASWERTADENERMHLAALRNRGFVETPAGRRPKLSDETAFSLLLTDTPPVANRVVPAASAESVNTDGATPTNTGQVTST